MDSIDNLVNWALEGNAVIDPHLKLRELKPHYYGGVYEGNTEPSDESKSSLIRLPLKLAITLDDAINSFQELSKFDIESISYSTSNINSLLKMYLARERTATQLGHSKYGPYLTMLPKLQNMTTPYCWSPKIKELVKGTNLGNSLKDNISHLVEEWWQMVNLLPDDIEKPQAHYVNMKFFYEYKFYKDEDIYEYFVVNEDPDNWTSFPNYLWASLILKSRAFPAYLAKEYSDRKDRVKQDEAMLLPVIDLLNHDAKSKANWSTSESNGTPYFNLGSESIQPGLEVFNNYGMKGNEELLLGYGFCVEGNNADSAALKIRIPSELRPEIEKFGVKLPSIEDYTTSVIRVEETREKLSGEMGEQQEDCLFFINSNHIPESLIDVFSVLSKNGWENRISLRMKLAGINKLRQALDAKSRLIPDVALDTEEPNLRNIEIYVKSQKRIFASAIKTLKRTENVLLHDDQNKQRFLTLKNVYKRDVPFQHSLLINLGISSYDQLIESQFQDQCWLLYLMRCFNRAEYIKKDEESHGESLTSYIPEWITRLFRKIEKEVEITPEEKTQYKPFYDQLIPELRTQIPEIYDVGNWSLDLMVLSAKLLDSISFVRGKEQECILVEQNDFY